jgi:hypothetical protein
MAPRSDYCAPSRNGFVWQGLKRENFDQAQDAPMEMRREIRYRLDARTLFSWESPQHSRVQAEGVTRDISVLGAFILTSTCPPVGIPVQVEIVLPSLTGIKPIIRVSGEARVSSCAPFWDLWYPRVPVWEDSLTSIHNKVSLC